MTDLMKSPIPRFQAGPVQGPDLERVFTITYRDVFSRMDLRYSNNDLKGALVGDKTGAVTIGDQAILKNRAAGLPTVLGKITDGGVAQDQRFLPQVSAGNKLSVQSTLPLSASSDASTATITIQAHSVQYGFGGSSYGSGTISGLLPNTQYYVYANDPAYFGGAATYLATTNAQTVVSSNGNYYVGQIVTPVSSTLGNITAATSASPIVFTTGAAHGWNSNDQVTFASLPGDFGTNLNGQTKTITVITPTTFSIAVDGHTFVAYTTGGTATRVTTGSTGGGGGGGGGGGRSLL